MKNKGIGEFEELVLLAVCILEGEAYGISVKKEVERHSGRTILLGAIHSIAFKIRDCSNRNWAAIQTNVATGESVFSESQKQV
jgi:hypothetical protein